MRVLTLFDEIVKDQWMARPMDRWTNVQRWENPQPELRVHNKKLLTCSYDADDVFVLSLFQSITYFTLSSSLPSVILILYFYPYPDKYPSFEAQFHP